MTLWGADTVKDVAESVGITGLNKDVNAALCRDVEYRISQVLEEALKFMRHARRTILWSQDISQALRVLDIEPLYGYESTRPLRYGEASIGPGQPLFYVEDEEMDFEKMINAPLPKVPREVSFTAHWLAVEGVQPSIPQNPTTSEARDRELMPKGPNINPALAAMNSADSTVTKPQVKHVLSKELQLFFERVCQGVLNDESPELRQAALASIAQDPGLHQLVPYFISFIANKVTHSLQDLFVLTQMMYMMESLMRNSKLNLGPYIQSLPAPVITCLISRQLGTGIGSLDHFDLRDLAASVLKHICDKYSTFAHTLRARLARVCLKTFLDPKKSFGSHYGAILGLRAAGGAESIRKLVLPTLRSYEEVLVEDLHDGSVKKAEAEKVVAAIIGSLGLLVEDAVVLTNGHSEEAADHMKARLIEKVGQVIGERIAESGRLPLARAILDDSLDE